MYHEFTDLRYSIRSIYGYATIKDLGEVLLGDINPTHKEYKIYSIDGGYLLWGNINGWPLDIYAKGGVNYYDEAKYTNSYGADLYIKAIWNFDVWQNRVRFGVGEGDLLHNKNTQD